MAEGTTMKKSVRSQFEYYYDSMHHENKKTQKYPDYDKYGERKLKMPKPDVVEFGKAFDVSALSILTDNLAIKAAYDMALTDYFQAKAENFPGWEGLPSIKVQEPKDPLQRFYRIGWHVVVPKKFVIDQDQKLEEDLWNS